MSFLEIALSCIKRGWYVFPCWPKTKQPITKHGFKDASNNEDQIRFWFGNRDNNVAIATGPSGLTVLDIDHGFNSLADYNAWASKYGHLLPVTYCVRSGRRDSFGVQVYLAGYQRQSIPWELDGCSGDIRSETGYIMAAGSVHDKTGERYELLFDPNFIADVPPWIRELKSRSREQTKDDGSPITANRNNALTSIAGKLRNAGLSAEALEVALLQVNADRCTPPLEEDEVKRIAANASKWELPQQDPIAVLGATKGVDNGAGPGKPVIMDWREHYHTLDEMESAPPVTYLIDGFLPDESIAGLAAPAGQRKSLIALNVAHSLCTGEPLFGHFEVIKQPSRVLYLCPEMGIRAFTDRLRKIGLMQHVGKTLFCRTMTKAGMLELDELQPEELAGAVVILDTAIRYLKGDENSSEHMRKFASSVFKLSENGAASVLVLHHSAKGTKESNELTLENSMRGSGELGAFLTTCWATRLQDPTEPYKSASYLSNVKQRDFPSDPFEVIGKDGERDCRLWYVETEGPVILQRRNPNKPNKDGKDDAAIAMLKAYPKLSHREMSALLAEHGIKRGKDWVNTKRNELCQANGGMMP